jgi:hypothetical protein
MHIRIQIGAQFKGSRAVKYLNLTRQFCTEYYFYAKRVINCQPKLKKKVKWETANHLY